MKEKVIVSWSGGKDSALALYETLRTNDFEVLELLTTVTSEYDRISIHGVRRVLLEEQARSLGFPLEEMLIRKGITDEDYEEELKKTLEVHQRNGIRTVVFGDIFLEDVRKYREQILSRASMEPIFPLWKKDTKQLAHYFINLGFKAIVTVVDSTLVGKEFAGREFDERFLSDLPPNVDPCGENGEFHTFVYDGPIFKEKIPFMKGKIVFRENRFYYCDLIQSEDKPRS